MSKTTIINLLSTAILLCGTMSVQAETLRGTVKDAVTGEALIGATVKIAELENAAAVADMDGNFTIKISKGGRYTIETNYIVMKEILISGPKEVVLEIALRENSTELKEVVVKPRVNKEATVNPSVLTGGVMLSMEEASRFAGGYNDPARLVMSFAGVSGDAGGSGLSIHGNAPERMQYRLRTGERYELERDCQQRLLYFDLQRQLQQRPEWCVRREDALGKQLQAREHPADWYRIRGVDTRGSYLSQEQQ